MDNADASCQVCVIYALQRVQWVIHLRLPARSVVGDAVSASGLLTECPELGVPGLSPPTLDVARYRLASYGQLRGIDEPLGDGQRIEILRPLQADPKEARRRKALVNHGGKRRQRSCNPTDITTGRADSQPDRDFS